MSWTKRQIVEAAFEEIGIGGYNFDIQPEMFEIGLKRLDALMATWNAKGIRLGYPIQSTPDFADLDEDSMIPDSANEAAFLNLTLRICPVFGKQISPELKQSAFIAYQAMLTKSMIMPQRQINQSVPAGQGNKWRRFYSPYLTKPEDAVSDNDGVITYN